MSIALLLVVSLIFSAVALPTKNLQGNDRSLVRKSRDVGLGFGISGSINGYAGYNGYDGYYGGGQPWNYGYDGLLNPGYGGIYGGVDDGYGYSPDYYDYHHHHHQHHHHHNQYEYDYDRFNQYHYYY